MQSASKINNENVYNKIDFEDDPDFEKDDELRQVRKL